MAVPTFDNITNAYVDNGTTQNPVSVMVPSGSGDLLLAFIVCFSGSTFKIAGVPSGWSELGQELGQNPNAQIMYYDGDASAVSGPVDFYPASVDYTDMCAVMARISGADYTTLVADFTPEKGTGASSEVKCPSVVVPDNDSLLMRIAFGYRSNSDPYVLAGYSAKFNGDFGFTYGSLGLFGIGASSGASGTAVITADIASYDDYVGGTLAVGPASTPSTYTTMPFSGPLARPCPIG